MVDTLPPRAARRVAAEPGAAFEGIGWHSFWGFLNHIVAILAAFVVMFGTSLMKVVVAFPLALFFLLALPLVFILNLKSTAAPRAPADFVGIIWPLSATYQGLVGLCVGVVVAYVHQWCRLHIHHDIEDEAERYLLWIASLFAVLFTLAFTLGVLTDCGPTTMKDHSD
eukprot:TRINITY_DN12461_c0_g1_i1.p2 TRINITY_DN12461_c0_g1~~TRINITY_DN12461_c0_g1_i1.p2  ORF type:complete len:168 (+),score=52.17 TRINITY_DN12461_c0_g1_i1:86-589(+)